MRLHAAPVVANLLGCLLGLGSAGAAENQLQFPVLKTASATQPVGEPRRDARAVGVRGGDVRTGADAKELADTKAKVKALLADALKAGNLWTVLQLEAYAVQKLGERKSGSVLGPSEIIGDPLFAFPQTIVAGFDRGDTISVVSGQHYYQLAPDGRPLALPLALPFPAQRAALSEDAKMLALFSIHANVLNIAVRNVTGGAEVLRTEIPMHEEEYFRPGICIADDGSAVLVATDGGTGDARLVLASGGGKYTPFTELRRPAMVGSGGAWLIAEPKGGTWAERTRVLWRQGQAAVFATGGAALGPGAAALLVIPPAPKPPPEPAEPAAASAPAAAPAPAAPAEPPAGEGKVAKAAVKKAVAPPPPPASVLLVKPDGSTVELNLAGVLTRSYPRIDSVGRWLVVGAGLSQTTGVDTDAFGNLVQVGGQVYTTLFWRWKDLLADPAAPPAFKLAKPYVTHGSAPQVLCWQGPAVALLDLSGDDPVERPLFTASAAPDYIGDGPGGMVLHFADNRQVLCDDQGHQLWSGDDEGEITSQPWPWALIGHGPSATRTYELVRLDADPAHRASQKVPLPPGPWDIAIEPARERLIAVNSGVSWSELELPSLKARRNVQWSAASPAPEPQTLGYVISPRFRVRHARLLPSDLADAEDAPAHWSPRDACRVGQALLVLEHSGRVLISAKKKGPFQLLGYSDAAAVFGQKGNEPFLLDGEDRLVTAIVPGPALLEDFPARLTAGEPLPPGPWKVSGLTFAGPHGGVVTWEGKVGFTPRHLHSQAGSPGLLVVTDSLLIDLDPAVVRVVSGPERPAPLPRGGP